MEAEVGPSPGKCCGGHAYDGYVVKVADGRDVVLLISAVERLGIA